MTDSLLKVGSVTVIVRKCKDIVNVLHYKSDMLEQEVKDTNNELDRSQKSTGKKISEVQLIEDNDVMFTEEDEQTDTAVIEMEVETENRRS